MKHNLRLIVVVVGLLAFLGLLNAQVDTTTVNSGEKSELAIDGLVKKSTVSVEGNYAYRTFEVEIAEAGEYFLSAWLMGAQTKDGDYVPYDLIVNGVKQIAKIAPTRSNWQSVELKNEKSVNITVKLTSGLNKVIFVSELPDVADVEFVKFNKDANSVKLDDSKYLNYVKEARVNMELNKGLIGKDSVSTPKMQKVFQLPNPGGNYTHYMDVTFSYTTYKTYYFGAGQQVFFSTYAPSGYEHVLEVFSAYNNTENYSWTVLSGSNNMASLNINIPVSDTYYVRVRAYRQTVGAGGTVNLNVNGQYYFADTPVAGNGFANYHTPQEVLNYFTTHNTGDPRIWIESSNGSPGTICAFNDDYGYNGGDWSWGLNSRVKKQIGRTISAVLLSTYGSYNPTTTCDLYIGCKQSTINYGFQNLKVDDAIISGTSDGGSNPLINMNYNCASWGGGRIDLGRYFWASNSPDYSNLSSPWYVSGDFWLSWDKFFGNNPERYAGAVTYTRIGADATNGEVAMWYNNTDQVYTHFSVKKPANNQPHGYDWESKPGGYIRIFHPREALNNEVTYGYGHIQLYFKRVASSKAVYSLQESIDLGLTVLPVVNLTDTEQSIVNGLKSTISENVSTEFSKGFELLIKKANSSELMLQSNPIYLLQSDEYKNILSLCEKYNKSIQALLIEHIFSKNSLNAELAEMIFNTITEKEYGYLMLEVKNEWTNNCYDKSGAYIAPSPMNNTKNYIKKILTLVVIIQNSKVNPLITLTSEENDKVNLLYQAVSPDIKMEFNNLFVLLTNKINSPEFIYISNPAYLYATEEYKSLLNFCTTERQQNVWSMLIENIFDEQKPLIAELSSMIFINVTADKYGYLMDEVKSEWAQNCYDKDGNYINPSPQQNTRNYVKKVLATLSIGELKIKAGLNSLENNNATFGIYPTMVKHNANVEINLDRSYYGSLKIYNLNGVLLQTIFDNHLVQAGTSILNWNISNNISGVIVFSLTLDGQMFNRRILVE